ncbi:Uncharacterized protein dnl_09050 [Desulfonema limicola]|uniref:Uncharacterized protein n=1 Tax=Desulfonema limicola TaxID=45656 RepID=A0A975B4L1_9BACT|nr:hypothetical protein [Desulfonema limicola]QTA78676.1 Uncharacterized protein dnl_09050 [Desulfonema limicola]
MNNELRQLGKEWLSRLKEISLQGGCVGEIDLSEEETLRLSKKIEKDIARSSFFDNEIAAVLAVVAVNLAYYYYEGSGGESFLKFLIPDCIQNKKQVDRVKVRFENFLRSISLLSEIKGVPYRYVGLFVRQAIITKHYLPGLKYYLKRFNQLIGFEKFEDLSYHSYLNKLERILSNQKYNSGIFIETLKKQEGFHLIKTIALLLDQVRTSHVAFNKLKKRPGFRTGFWNELEELLNGSPSNEMPSQRYKDPFFVYDPEKCQIGIKFDSFGVSDRIYSIEKDSGRQLVEESFFPFLRDDQLDDTIKVSIKGLNTFDVRLWKPKLCEGFTFQAIFRMNDGRFKSSINHPRERLEPGTYYLITTGETDETVCKEIGIESSSYPLNLEGEQCYYDVWHFDLKPGIELPNLGKCYEYSEYSGLEWDNPYFFSGTEHSSGVFSGKLPRCRISGWKTLKHRYRLVIEYESDANRKIISEVEPEYQNDNAYYSFSPPEGDWKYLKGCLKLEILGYSTLIPNPSRLPFILLPKNTRIRWTYDLLSKEDKPQIFITSLSDLNMKWTPKPVNISSRTDQREYCFEPVTEMVYGKSDHLPDLRFHIHFSVAQAYLLNPPLPSARQFLWHSSLNESFSFFISGHRDSLLELGLSTFDNIDPIRVWQHTDEQKVKIRIPSRDLKDGLLGKPVVAGKFVVKYKDLWKETECVYLHEERLIESLEKDQIKEFFDHLPDDLKTVFQKAVQAIREVDYRFEHAFENNSHLPQKIKEFLFFVEIASKIFDFDEHVDLENSKYANIYYLSWLKWYNTKSLNPIIHFRNRPDTELPLTARWRDKINGRIRSLKELSNISRLISDWKGDVSDPFGKCKSTIATMDYGKELTLAAYHYAIKRHEQIFTNLGKIRNLNLPKPIEVLSQIIELLAKMRLWRYRDVRLSIQNSSEDPWERLLFQFKCIWELFGNISLSILTESGYDFVDSIQLLDILDETGLCDVINDIITQNWKNLKQSLNKNNDPHLLYLLYKNNDLSQKTEVSMQEVCERLKEMQKNGDIPYHIEI